MNATDPTPAPNVELLAAELHQLGQRLDRVRAELLRLPGGPGRAPYPGPPVHGPGGPWLAPPVNDPAGPWPGRPAPTGFAPSHQPYPAARAAGPARRPARRRVTALSGARLLAWTGAGVTLLGLVLLLVLAASRGWLAPPVRIGAGAALGATLIGLGCWLHRRESARTGAVALTATGLAALHLVLAAATAIYGYLDPLPALAVALLVAGGGLGLADRWRTPVLANGVVLATTLLAPVLASGWLLVALLLVLQLAALPVVLRRRWSGLMLLAAAGPVLTGAFGALVAVVERSGVEPAGIAAALGVLMVVLGTAAPAAGRLPARAVATLVALAPLPVLLTGVALDGWRGAGLCALAAAAAALLAAGGRADRAVRLVAGSVAALALFQATTVAVDGASLTAVVLGQAVAAAVLAAALRSRFALVAALAYGAFGVVRAVVVDAPLDVLTAVVPPGPMDALLVGAGVSVLVTALAVAALVAAGRVGWVRPDAGSAGLWAPVGLVGLYGATALTVTLALLVAPGRTGFTAGHALVTVSWAVLALALLARGVSRPALRVSGLVLVAAAVAKLVLFDLVELDGMARVAAFLGAGLVLLAAGSRYARLVAEAGPPAGR